MVWSMKHYEWALLAFFFAAIKYATIHLVEKIHNAGNDNKVYIVYLYI